MYTYNDFITVFKNTLDKHALLKQASRKDLKFKSKPWMTRGLQKSVATKNKLFKSCYTQNNMHLINKYKKILKYSH